MKILTLLTLLISTSALANVVCSSPEYPQRSYELKGSFERVELIVREGGKLIYREQMQEEDWQGEFTYTGKRGYIYFPHPDDVSYSYVVRLNNGTFSTKAINLKCN